MDEPVPIEGIIEGEPESLAALCAAGGSAVLAYCATVGVRARVAETVVSALATFRRGVLEHADEEPARLEKLLVSCTADAVRRVARVDPSPVQEAAAQVALETAVTAPLHSALVPRIIRGLVEAAPVTALGGDAAAVRRATVEHYGRIWDGEQAAAPVAPARAVAPSPAPAPPAARPPRDAEGEWVPPELTGVDADAAANASALVAPRRTMEREPPADPEPPVELPEHAPLPPPAAPTLPPAPGALVINRGGHWPFRRRSGAASRGGWDGSLASGRSVLLAGVAGLAVGAGVVALAMPEGEVQRTSSLVRTLDTPFTVDGAVFNVARTNQAEWALEVRRAPLRPDRAWLTLAVQTRNAGRPVFAPRSLGYRLRTSDGIVIGPDSAEVASNVAAAGGRQAVGARASVHLAFQVPRAQRGLTLEFDPSPRGPHVRVPLN